MCGPALPIIAAGMAAMGTAVSALQANAQAQYRAKIDERNAGMEREAAQQEIQNSQQERLALYRKAAQVEGNQRVAAAANGAVLDFGTAAQTASDTQMLLGEDLNRQSQQSFQRIRGYDINAANYSAQANADRSAGTAALVGGAFQMGSTILGGVKQYKALNPKNPGASPNFGG